MDRTGTYNPNMAWADVMFSVTSPAACIVDDHQYYLFCILANVLPEIHDAACPWQVSSITGNFEFPNRLRLSRTSHFRLRVPACDVVYVHHLLRNDPYMLGKAPVVFGVCGIRWFVREKFSPTKMTSNFVSFLKINSDNTVGDFKDRLLARVKQMHPSLGTTKIQIFEPRQGRKLVDRFILGWEVAVLAPEPDAAWALLTEGVGQSRHMDCGIFRPE